MEENYRLHLNKNMTELIELVSWDHNFLGLLKEKQVLLDREVQSLEEKTNPVDRNCKLFGLLLTKQGYYDAFLAALKETNQVQPYDILMQVYGRNPGRDDDDVSGAKLKRRM